MRSKVLNILSLLANAFTNVGAIAALAIIFVRTSSSAFTYFDTYLCFIILIVCLLGLIYNIKTFSNNKLSVKSFYLDIKLALAGVALINVAIGAGFIEDGIINVTFFIPRLILPILLALSFMFVEIEGKYSYKGIVLAPVPLLVYLIVVLSLVATKNMVAPFPYLDSLNNSWLTTLFIFMVLFTGTVLIAFILRLINKGLHFLVIARHQKNTSDNDWMPSGATSNPDKMKEILEEGKKEDNVENIDIDENVLNEEIEENIDLTNTNEPLKEETIVEVKELKDQNPEGVVIKDPNDEVKKDDETSSNNLEYEEKPTDTKTITRVYHVSHHKSQPKWQVKLAGSNKAVKLFKTQKEAIEYAKSLVKTQGGYYLVHGVDGKIRKD